jgi:hypothetical protein
MASWALFGTCRRVHSSPLCRAQVAVRQPLLYMAARTGCLSGCNNTTVLPSSLKPLVALVIYPGAVPGSCDFCVVCIDIVLVSHHFWLTAFRVTSPCSLARSQITLQHIKLE